MVRKELLGLRFENFPGRIGQHNVKATTLLHDVVKDIAPVERVLGGHVGQRDGSLDGFAECASGRIPGRLLEFDAALGKLVLEQFIHHRIGLGHRGVDVVAQISQADAAAQFIGGGAVGLQFAALFVDQFAKTLAEHVAMAVLGIKLMLVNPHQPDQ